MISTILLYHLPTNNRSNRPNLIGSENNGLLYTSELWTRKATKKLLGIISFEKTGGQVYALVNELITNNIIQAWSKKTCKLYLSSIGRLLQPVIEGQLAIQWLVEHISSARNNLNAQKKELSSEGIISLLQWEPNYSISRNPHTGNIDSNEQLLSDGRQRLTSYLKF